MIGRVREVGSRDGIEPSPTDLEPDSAVGLDSCQRSGEDTPSRTTSNGGRRTHRRGESSAVRMHSPVMQSPGHSEQPRRHAYLKSAVGAYGGSHDARIGRQIEQLPAIRTPPRGNATSFRHLFTAVSMAPARQPGLIDQELAWNQASYVELHSATRMHTRKTLPSDTRLRRPYTCHVVLRGVNSEAALWSAATPLRRVRTRTESAARSLSEAPDWIPITTTP